MLAANQDLLARQWAIAKVLTKRPPRQRCMVCVSPLTGARSFVHRGVPYAFCGACGHLQCLADPPLGYPSGQQDFGQIYPPLDAAVYRERTNRIYRPKLEWALRVGAALGLGDLLARSWIELGSGAGNFIAALREAGAGQAGGLEADARLVRQAEEALGEPVVRHWRGSLADAVAENPAEIYAAWFVLEHCFEIPQFLAALRQRPTGTTFLFSVPMVGLGTLLESAFQSHFARSLDSVLHLQLFTEDSVRHMLDQAGYEAKAEWLFGQDADDLYRCLAARLAERGSTTVFHGEMERLAKVLSGLQQVLDRVRLCDARHVLAVKS